MRILAVFSHGSNFSHGTVNLTMIIDSKIDLIAIWREVAITFKAHVTLSNGI